MTLQDSMNIVLTFLASLGGGAVIIAGFAHYLGGIWAKRLIQTEKEKLDEELESHKIRLKKSEFLFQKEFEAASAFIAYEKKLLPTFSHPEMDWYEACDEMARDLDGIESWIQNYLSTHGAILPQEVTKILSECRGTAGSNKFESGGFDTPVGGDANKAAEEIFKKFEEVESILIETVRKQSNT